MKTTKISTLALALSGVCAAFSAQAADVGMYGILSTGLVYQDMRNGDSRFGMSTNLEAHDQSRWGIKAREELGGGRYVGVQLEGGFKPDTGEMADAANGRLFDRVARVYAGNDLLEVSAGHMAAFTIAADPYSAYARLRANMTMTSMQGFAPAAFTFQPGYVSNAVAFRTNPKEGVFVQGFYSNGDSTKAGDFESEYGWSDNRHVGQFALGWVGEKLRAGTILSYEMPGDVTAGAERRDATQGIHLVASYDFGGPAVSALYYHGKNDWRLGASPDMAKVIGSANGVNGAEVINRSRKGMTSDALFFSARYPLGRHDVTAALGMLKADWKGDAAGLKETDGKVAMGGVLYHHNFSKRTFAYAGASYARGSGLLEKTDRFNQFFATAGLTKRF